MQKCTKQLTGCRASVVDTGMADSALAGQEQTRCSSLVYTHHSDCQLCYPDSSAYRHTNIPWLTVDFTVGDLAWS